MIAGPITRSTVHRDVTYDVTPCRQRSTGTGGATGLECDVTAATALVTSLIAAEATVGCAMCGVPKWLSGVDCILSES